MAVNLRSRLSPGYTLLVADVNQDAISRFQKQVERESPVAVESNGFEAAKARGKFVKQIDGTKISRILLIETRTWL